jgi:hypothetical protein
VHFRLVEDVRYVALLVEREAEALACHATAREVTGPGERTICRPRHTWLIAVDHESAIVSAAAFDFERAFPRSAPLSVMVVAAPRSRQYLHIPEHGLAVSPGLELTWSCACP